MLAHTVIYRTFFLIGFFDMYVVYHKNESLFIPISLLIIAIFIANIHVNNKVTGIYWQKDE